MVFQFLSSGIVPKFTHHKLCDVFSAHLTSQKEKVRIHEVCMIQKIGVCTGNFLLMLLFNLLQRFWEESQTLVPGATH